MKTYRHLIATFALAITFSAAAQTPKTLNQVHPEYREAAVNWVIDFADSEVRKQSHVRNQERAAQAAQPAEQWQAPAQGTQPAVDLYVYKPKTAPQGALPVVYFIHGGGYLMGNAKMNGDSLQALADAQQSAVVSVEYRLAPEAPFPADLNDAYHGLTYVYRHAAEHGLDNSKVVLMGESAGGGLAARLALYTRDQGEFEPAGQVLIYPMLDYRTGTPQSPYQNPHAGEFVWTAAANQVGWKTLRGGQTIADKQMPYYSAAMAKELSGLPPTYIVVGDLDLFVNEDIDYANRLIQAGVATELSVLSGVFHAFEIVNPAAEPSQRYLRERNRAISEVFGR